MIEARLGRLTYREARYTIEQAITPGDVRKRAVQLLYLRTGGNKWLPPEQVTGIIKQARAEAANESQAKPTAVLSIHEWGVAL